MGVEERGLGGVTEEKHFEGAAGLGDATLVGPAATGAAEGRQSSNLELPGARP